MSKIVFQKVLVEEIQGLIARYHDRQVSISYYRDPPLEPHQFIWHS